MKTLEIAEPETTGLKGDSIIQLPLGLLGFEHVKNYIIAASPDEQPFMWLQMVDHDKKAFLVVSPFLVMPDYQPDISEDDADFLGLTNSADALVLNIVTLRPGSPGTINLKGPIVINRHTLIGKQVIPNNASKYSLRHLLPTS